MAYNIKFQRLLETKHRLLLGRINDNSLEAIEATAIVDGMGKDEKKAFEDYEKEMPTSRIEVGRIDGMWGWTEIYADGHVAYRSIGD